MGGKWREEVEGEEKGKEGKEMEEKGDVGQENDNMQNNINRLHYY